MAALETFPPEDQLICWFQLLAQENLNYFPDTKCPFYRPTSKKGRPTVRRHPDILTSHILLPTPREPGKQAFHSTMTFPDVPPTPSVFPSSTPMLASSLQPNFNFKSAKAGQCRSFSAS